LTITDSIENFPGHPEEISGPELMDLMRQQVEKFGVDIRQNICVKSDLSQAPYHFWFDDESEVTADAVIIATGASAKFLGLDDEKKYMGQGVSACATCDGFFYRKRVVAVVGGGDTACGEAIYLAGLAAKVYLIVRKPYLRATKIMQERVMNNPKIEVLFETNTLGLYGENGVEGAHLVHRKGEADEKKYDLPIDGFFLAIGHKPNSDIFKPWIETDGTGFIKTEGASPKTNIPGVFAAGDVADPTYRQAVVAAGSGCKAAMEAEKYLMEIKN
jgi:thioredoxin reductase (NADPH)